MNHKCIHEPCCPTAESGNARVARVCVRHHEQGWCLLCNGVIAFDDGGAILPTGVVLAPVERVLTAVGP